jgi:hypothetical protein
MSDKLPREASMGLVPEVVQVELVDEALDREVDLGALPVRGDPIAHPDQFDASEPEAAVETHELAHIAGQTREILDQKHLEGGRRGERGNEELLVTRAVLGAEA